MGKEIDDPIAHLDFAPSQPKCECVECEAHDGPCPDFATFAVKVHAGTDCNRPGLTPDGGIVAVCCPVCAMARAAAAGKLSGKLYQAKERTNRTVECRGCGRPLLDPSDFFEIRSLDDDDV